MKHPTTRPAESDPFQTAEIRDRVLAGWAASAARFREDANAEEDLALGGYRDRLVVELAQNATDATVRAGQGAGRLRLTLRDDAETRTTYGGPVLVAANSGAPLTAEGVQSLATLRASAKPTEATSTVGRFGVGFAAVLAITDEPAVLSRTGGVRFSREDTADEVSAAAPHAPELAEEVRRRDGHVPALRLPYAAHGAPPDGFDTAVVLPLRDEAAADLVRRLLAEVDDALLLALPALARIEIDVEGEERVLADAAQRWRVHRVGGAWDEAQRATLLEDRPSEERRRSEWSVVWAVPRDHAVEPPSVIYAPTPTDEPSSVPALLIASFPLDPTRRHVATGRLTDRLVREASTAYADLLGQLAVEAEEPAEVVLPLVPGGLPGGALDAALHEAIRAVLPRTPLLAPAERNPVTEPTGDPVVGPAEERPLVRPADAVTVEPADPALVDVLASAVAGLIHGPTDSAGRVALRALGVRRLELADLVDELAAVAEARPPAWWRSVYAALGPAVHDPLTREALGALPVPLADGRVVRGARGVLLPGPPGRTDGPADGTLGAALETLAPYGLRIAHPDAMHPSLERLGAIARRPRELLEDGAVAVAVEESPDAEEPSTISDAVMLLVSAAVADGELAPGDLRFLGDLALYDADGELMPAEALVLPDSEASVVLDPEEYAVVDPALVETWGEDALEAVGVVRTLGVVIAADVDLAGVPEELLDLDGFEDWIDEVVEQARSAGGSVESPAGVVVGELRAVRDLDFVRTDAWPRVVALLAGEPTLRRSLVEPARLVAPDGTVVPTVSYSAWWLRRNVVRGAVADPDAETAVTAVLDPAPSWLAGLDAGCRRALGLLAGVEDLDEATVETALTRLAEPDRELSVDALLRWWSGLARSRAERALAPEPPDRVRVLTGAALHDPHRPALDEVVGSADATVVDGPAWLQLDDLGGMIVAAPGQAADLADLLDVALVTERHAGRVDAGLDAQRRHVPAALHRFVAELPAYWWEYADLRVDGRSVDWWVDENGRVHAATHDGLAHGLAWAAGRWSARHLVSAVLAAPERADLAAVLDAFG